MRIDHLEILNFRKLLAVRVDLSARTTLLVGANNSGKTSAMIALRHFLVDSAKFCMNDLTLSHWPQVNRIGEVWRSPPVDGSTVAGNDWPSLCPALDIWLSVAGGELHYVRKMVPTLDWAGGLLGVRLRFEPTDLAALRADYLSSLAQVEETKKAIPPNLDGTPSLTVKLWPENLVEFLERRLRTHFAIRAYILDPTKLVEPKGGQAQPQTLSEEQEPIEIDHLKSLMRIDEIDAQRGFGQVNTSDEQGESSGRRRLSAQLRSYFSKHLNPADDPGIDDLQALQAIEGAQKAFDDRLDGCFKFALDEVQGLGYPGVSDPRITISTRLHPVDGLNHEAAVLYRVDAQTADGSFPVLRLPEDFNGLGYQNLISMIFRLMSFRDGWMRVGKATKKSQDHPIPPLHLVLVEEPEAHLHAQVQQVFAKKAYAILRAHSNLGDKQDFTTQLIVSSHSIHVAHELDFSCLRYFRRLPAGAAASVPVSTVINLKEVFGAQSETERFVRRYLKAQHCDLFFADAAILVEGPAERMLVPHFIREKYGFLNQCYVTILEIGGSHAHRLRPLIQHLGLTTVVITDIDTEDAEGRAVRPQRNMTQKTNNDTLKKWVPQIEDADQLFDLTPAQKVVDDDGHLFAVRVAYQTPCLIALIEGDPKVEALPYTFEDALVFENRSFFSTLHGVGLVARFREAISNKQTLAELGEAFFDALLKGVKAEFALDVMTCEDFEKIKVPTYIAESLEWLESRLKKKQTEILPVPPVEQVAEMVVAGEVGPGAIA